MWYGKVQGQGSREYWDLLVLMSCQVLWTGAAPACLQLPSGNHRMCPIILRLVLCKYKNRYWPNALLQMYYIEYPFQLKMVSQKRIFSKFVLAYLDIFFTTYKKKLWKNNFIHQTVLSLFVYSWSLQIKIRFISFICVVM